MLPHPRNCFAVSGQAFVTCRKRRPVNLQFTRTPRHKSVLLVVSTPRYRFDILKFLWNFKAIKSLRDFNVFRDCEIKSACERIFREIAEAYGLRKIALQFLHTKSLCDLLVTIYELQVMPDHIHLFVGFGPNTCPSERL